MVQLRGPLQGYAQSIKTRDLRTRGKNGRYAVTEKHVAFIERAPLALKNHIQGASKKGQAKGCMQPMMEMLQCLEKYDQNQVMCSKEIKSFQTCYDSFKADLTSQRLERKKYGTTKIPPGTSLTTPQVNKYLSKFPSSERTEQWYIPSKKS